MAISKERRKSKSRDVPIMDAEVPKRLRAEREQVGISVREMARRVDVSPSAISQIETGRARPSVSLLYAIVTELGLSLDELFQSDAAGAAKPSGGKRAVSGGHGEGSVQKADSRVAIDLDTGVRWERLTASPDPDVDFLFVTYPPGSSSSPAGLMRHAGVEYGLVLSGELEVTTGFNAHKLGPGDSIRFDSTVPHRLSNVSEEPATGVWFVIGRGSSDPRGDVDQSA